MLLNFFVRTILLCGFSTFALYAQPTATWSGSGDWSNGANWHWAGDAGACSPDGMAIPPGTIPDNSSICYTANVMIPSGSVNVDVQFRSVINNFTLGSGASLYGVIAASGNATVGQDAYVSQGIQAATGVLTNQGTIVGFATAATLNNSGTIKATGLVFASGAATNAGTIEAIGANSGLTGNWNNAGTIQIDSGAVLTCDATITGGSIMNNGGVVGGAGNGLTLAGSVSTTSLAIDGVGGPTTVTITGSVSNSGMLTIGQTNSVSTLKVINGGTLAVTGGNTTLGVQAKASGQLELSGTSAIPSTVGNLIIGDAGTGYVAVNSGAALTAGVITLGNQATGNGELAVNGSVKYASLMALRGTTIGVPVWVYGGGTLTSVPQNAPTRDYLGVSGIVTGALSAWNSQNALTVNEGGSLSISSGGKVNITCTSCPSLNTITNWSLTDAFQVSGNATVSVTAGLLSAAPNSGVGPDASLMVNGGGSANLGNFFLQGKATVDGENSSMNLLSNKPITAIYSGGVLTVQNEGRFTSYRMLLYGQAPQFMIQSQGEATLGSPISPPSGPALQVQSGGVLIQSDGALQVRNNAVIGGGAAPATITATGAGTQGGTLLSAGIEIRPNGLLRITGGDIVSLGSPATVTMVPGTPPGTIDVSQGVLNIGSVPAVVGNELDSVAVFPGGTLRGGQECPDGDAYCNINTFINAAGQVIINGSVLNLGGTISLDPTTLSVSQNFQQSSGTLQLQMDGTQSSQYDQVSAGGSLQISGGTVELDFANGFAPASGDKFNLLSAGGGLSVSGANVTTTGVASGFNFTTNAGGSEFDLTATNNGTATTSAPPPPPKPTLSNVDAASNQTPLAPGSLASGYGSGLITGQPITAPFPWPTTLGGVSVNIADLSGATIQAPLLYVSSTLIDYMVPDDVVLGPATVSVTNADGTVNASGPIDVVPVGPGLFAVNSAGLSASFADCVAADGTQTTVLTSQVVNGALVAVPLNLKACQETVLELWTTGLDEVDPSTVQVTIGGQDATVLFAGPQGVFPGVDQVNVVIPQSLAGSGSVPIVVSTGGVTSNTVNVTLQ